MSRADLVRFPLLEAGQPYPLGATVTEGGINFAVFSAHATRVDLCIFDEAGRIEVARRELPEFTDEVWHGFLPGGKAGLVYGYRVHGPWQPEEGHRFNPHKLLLDPYAREWVGQLRWSPVLFAGDAAPSGAPLGVDKRDSASYMPKARVVADLPPLSQPRPAVPWDRSVIYECHVRGMTRQHPQVPGRLRGTFAGLAHDAVIAHLVSLGVTAVELLPVHAFVDDAQLTDRGLRNYWGYNTLGFFALEQRYLGAGGIGEFRAMAERLHAAGIELILDVVYNHTAEGNEMGPTLSFKGLDNACWYRLNPENKRHYINDTGTGNTLNLSHPRVLQMVMDSLRYWVVQMGVDGFRFDLATILGREATGFDQGCGFFDAMAQDPVLQHVKLIAEPWDCGPGGYQPGNFPPRWAEWNDAFRDTVRSFWRGDEMQAAALATRLTGSADRFDQRGRRPWASVNFITAHDGFTLHDLVSYNHKRNDANGEDNRDGHDDNRSWNCGAEGPTDDSRVLTLRERQKRNMLATLLLSQGTPMLLAGDEFGRSQQGNNNAYCQDNELSWLNWTGLDDPAGEQLSAFVCRLLKLRAALPALRMARFATGGDPESTFRDVVWLRSDGEEMQAGDWNDAQMRCFGMRVDGRALRLHEPDPAAETLIELVVNASPEDVGWTLDDGDSGYPWRRLIDTSSGYVAAVEGNNGRVLIAGRSLQLFATGLTAGGEEMLAALQRALDGVDASEAVS